MWLEGSLLWDLLWRSLGGLLDTRARALGQVDAVPVDASDVVPADARSRPF